MLDEMPNASKFAILYIYENPKWLFPFFFSCFFIFSIMNALVYVDINLGVVIDRTLALSETNRTELSAILCQKLLQKFGRTELSVDPYSKAKINIF